MHVCKYRFECKNGMITIVNCRDEQVGYLEYTEPDELEMVVRIQNMKVSPQSRDKGIGSELINHLKEKCKQYFNSCDIEVDISPIEEGVTVEDLVRFYRKNNFAISNYYDDPYGCFGKFSFNEK